MADNNTTNSLSKKELVNPKKEEVSKQSNSFEKIYNEMVEDLRGNLTNEEYKELITLEYVLTWGYDKNNDEGRYKELRLKKDERA